MELVKVKFIVKSHVWEKKGQKEMKAQQVNLEKFLHPSK